MALKNAITEASGNWELLPDGRVLMAIPFKDNHELSDMNYVEQCLREIAYYYPRIANFEVTVETTRFHGYVLQIIVTGR